MVSVLIGLLIVTASATGETVDRVDARTAGSEEFFELRVRPLLAAECVKCHGATKQSGGLRLDTREGLLAGGDLGPAVVPDDPEEGTLLRAIRHNDEEDVQMPPAGPLAQNLQDDLAAWIAAGAPWPESTASEAIEGESHWAFEPLQTGEPPEDATGWASTPIDRLIAAERNAKGLNPVGRADRRALIRRATLDLTGLPPEPDRVEAFAADDRPDAFAHLIDELLASPQYGERWGRYWLDLARYADTAGDNSDYPIPEAYLYRDYVIDAFNADVPYDRFLHEQLAGDILAAEGPSNDYARRVIATGYLAQAKRFGTFKLEDTHQIIEDVLQTTGQVVLGLSLRCARCHDHKYDPVSANDYYALYGFFAGAKFPFAGAEEERRPSEFAPLVPPDQIPEYEARYAETLARLQANLAEADGQTTADVDACALAVVSAELAGSVDMAAAELTKAVEQRDARLKPLRAELAKLEKEGPLGQAPHAYAVRDGAPTDVQLQIGGDPRKLGDLVPRGVPKVLDPAGTISLPEVGSGRLALAHWLTDGPPRDLAARVMVNRIWQHHFGRPIVATPSDFGLRGIPPTHPALLDRLAADFIASGWSIKAMHRTIMLTETYQLATEHDSANYALDTGNTWYWRADRRPLDAEALRDGLLALGGNLRVERPGPHPFPAKESWTYTAHHQFKAVYPSEHRSVYLMVQRLHPHPYLSLFNGPDTSATTAVRDGSPVALQALYLLNSPFVHEQAERFADRLLGTASDASDRMRLAYLLAYGRPPSPGEQARTDDFLEAYRRSLADEGVAAEARDREVWTALGRTLFASNEFLYID